jgi:hypothetical protein
VIAAPDDLVIRPIADAAELDLFCALRYTLDVELADDLARGLRRPEWMWVALRGGRVVARAAWWGSDAVPSLLDFLDVGEVPDRMNVGVSLLTAALSEITRPRARPLEYVRFVPSDWRDHASTRRYVQDLMAIAGIAGAHMLAERLRFEWSPGTPIAAPTGRVGFRPGRSDGELLDLMARVLDGTLDAHSRRDLARMSAREAAVRFFENEIGCSRSPREWWRVAALPSGDPVGFVFPVRNSYGPIIAYLGVLPAHRGHGYVDDILAEGTRILAAQRVSRIRAATDLGNAPMADAFTRAGWVNFERSINMAWD